MIDVSIEVNGRKVTPKTMKDAFEASILESLQENIVKSVGRVRCSEHGEKPQIKIKGKKLDSLSLEVSGCCDTLVNNVKHKLSQ